MKISINGEKHDFESKLTVEQLLRRLEKNPKFLAVEVNRELVSRKVHSVHQLSDGDEVEIVTLVGGG